MPDVLSGASESGPRRWLPGALLGTLTVVATVVLVHHRDRDGRPVARVAPVTAYVVGADRPGEPTRLDLRTGQRAPIRGLPSEPTVRAVRGGAVAQAAGRSYLIRGRRVVRTLPAGDRAAPGTAGGLWVQRGRSAWPVDLTGRPHGRRIGLPAGTTLRRGTDHGLLLSTSAGRAELWAHGRVTGRWGTYLDATGDRVAWLPPQCPTGPVQVTRLDTGSTRTVALPLVAGRRAAVFSPDGRRLAVLSGVVGAGTENVYLADPATGRPRRVTGTEQRYGTGVDLAFSADSRWLVATVSADRGGGDERWIALWEPGHPRSQVVARAEPAP